MKSYKVQVLVFGGLALFWVAFVAIVLLTALHHDEPPGLPAAAAENDDG